MEMKTILEVGKNKNGEMDFGINCTIQDLNYDQMNEFRTMIVVAIGVAEDMWRRAQQSQPTNQPVSC